MSFSSHQQILKILFESQNETLSLSQVSAASGIDKVKLQRDLDELNLIGYHIENIPHVGFRFRSTNDVLIADEIIARLPDNLFTKRLTVFKETESTNSLLLHDGHHGAPEGTTIVAESQTKGRGRHGRQWQSAAHLGLWVTFLFRPQWNMDETYLLTFMACVALHRAIETLTGLNAQIKWPNDLYIQGKKVAGILTETVLSQNKLNFAVVGLGCNINHELEHFSGEVQQTAGSIKMFYGNAIRRADLFVELLKEMESLYKQPKEKILSAWKEHCLSLGKTIQVRCGNKTFQGEMLDLDHEGTLILQVEGGHIQQIRSGEILDYT
jgi:BirA family biotin operon repressor/biotin-[acetyl-CoA-carboxylase] ligase